MFHLLPASTLLGSIMLCSLVLVIHDGASASVDPGSGALPQNPAKGSDTPRYTGHVGEWWVAAPGRVQFQLLGTGRDVKDGKQPDLWFETPADKDMNTLFENLVLDVLMQSVGKNLPLTVEAKNSSGDDGSTHEKAFDILRVGFGSS